MSDISRKLESKVDRKLAKSARGQIFDGFESNKVVNEVLDKPTMLILYGMINSHIISYVNGIVSAGKESVLFWAVNNDVDVAIKVHLVTTSNFKRRQPYILGDPRFSRIKKGTRNLVNLWARKEFANLVRCHESGLLVPKPLYVSKNVLAMEFVGTNGVPASTLLESRVDMHDYTETISMISKLYKTASLVHGDLSPYNIFKTDDSLMLFDLGSAVDTRHPNSKALLKRDINNITNFFVKRGLVVENPLDVFESVIR